MTRLAAMSILTIEDLEVEIRTRKRRPSMPPPSSALAQGTSGETWRPRGSRTASYCGAWLRLRLPHFEGWPVWPEQ